ncbi:MAG: hypothetical protein ACRDKA_11975, partial [Actinomycetota bacterium]
GLAVDARSDIYSLGCLLHEMLTGRPPFTGDTPVAIAYKHVNEAPRPPSDLVASTPHHLDSAVMRALEKDPEARFPSAEAFRAALTRGEPGTATVPIASSGGDTDVLPATPPTPARGAPPSRRAPPWFPALLVAAAILAMIGVLALALREPEPAGRQERADRQEQPPAEEPTTPAALSVDQALGGFEDLVVEAVETGQVSEELGGELLEEAAKAADEYSNGDLDKALEHLAHAHEDVDKGLAEGQVASTELADTLHGAIETVAQAMQASPPATVAPDEGEDGDDDDDGDEEGFIPPGLEKKDDKGKGKGNGGD